MSSLLNKSLASIQSQHQTGSTPTGPKSSNSVANAWQHDLHAGNNGPAQQYNNNNNNNSRGPQRDENAPSNRLVVENLHYEVSERELQLLFAQIGPIVLGPSIRFDRSGRSMGTAYISFEKEAHAVKAKSAFDGAPAKGQNITVRFDHRPIKIGTGAPGTLLARMEPTISQSKSKSKPYDPPASRTTATTTAAPARGGISARGPSTRGTGRGGRGGVAGARRESGGRGVGGGGGKEKKEPKTSSQLDDELEAFMRAPVTGGEKVTAAVTSTNDVEMA